MSDRRSLLRQFLEGNPPESPGGANVQLYNGPIYPGHGYPARPREDRPGLSPFGRLTMGQNLGKSSILIYDHESPRIQEAPVDMITIEGDDADACQMVVTLHPPRVIPRPFDDVLETLDQQNLTGEQTNAEVTRGHFPGTHRHMRWPPLEAMIEFGTGGVNTQVVVDYLNGVTFSVTASYLRVHALISQSKDSGDIYGTSAAYYTAAHVGPGFAESHARRTVFVGEVVNDHESCVYETPVFAKRAALAGGREHHHHPVLPAAFIRFWQSSDGTDPVGDFYLSGLPGEIDVPNGGMYFSIFNQAGHEMKLSVVFTL